MFKVNLVLACGLVLAQVCLISSSLTEGRGFALDCDSSYSVACFKKDIVAYIEKLSGIEEVNIFPGMSVVKDEAANSSKTAEIVAGKLSKL